MRIILYANPRIYGGLVRHIELLLEGLTEKNDVILIIPEEYKEYIPEPSLMRSQIENYLVKDKYDIGGFYRLHAFLKSIRPDVFHAHLASPGESTLPFLASAIAAVPVTISTEHLPFYFPLKRFYSKTVKRVCTTFIDRIISISENGKRFLVREYGINPGKISVVHNGIAMMDSVSEAEKRRIRSDLGIGESAYVITSISEISERKNISLLLQVAEQLIKRKENVCFLIIGEGPVKGDLEKKYEDYIRSRHVVFPGHQKNIRQFLSVSDLYVLPSSAEEIPFSLLEAMSAGVPVIATSVGGIPEVINHAVSGWLIEPHDAPALHSAMIRFIENREEARTLATNALGTIRTDFSLSGMICKTEEIYDSLLTEKRGKI